MKLKLSNITNTSDGFTFIEIIVVIVILGVLFALATPNYFNALKSGRDSKRRSDLINVRQALQEYYGDWQRYPADDDNGHISGFPWGESFVVSAVTYLSELPIDPYNAFTYWYEQTGENNYVLEACLERPRPEDHDSCVYLTDCPNSCFHP